MFVLLFTHALPAKYSVLNLLGVLSGGNEPPCVKGGGSRKRDGGIVKIIFRQQTIPQSPTVTAPFTQGSLWFVRHESLAAFPDKHCFCGHKSEASCEAGRVITWMLFGEYRQ